MLLPWPCSVHTMREHNLQAENCWSHDMWRLPEGDLLGAAMLHGSPPTSAAQLLCSQMHVQEALCSDYVYVREGLVNQWEMIYQDQSVKDVQIILRDEERLLADSLVLKASSPVFRAMLTHDMQEKRQMVLTIDDYSVSEFRFFLRLLYTGRIDPADWPEEQLEDQDPGQFGSTSPVSQPPATAQPVLPFESRNVEQQGVGPLPFGSFVYSARSAQPHQVPLLQGKGKGKARGWPRQAPAHAPPVTLLLSASALAKRYQVEWLLPVLVDVLMRRITEASLESILLTAMSHDITPVRLGVLEFAKRSVEVRRRYDAGDYPPEILFELQAVYPLPPAVCNRGARETISI